jgi:hypothetical protein
MLTFSCADGLTELCDLSRKPLCFVPDLCVLSHSGLCIVSVILCFVPLLVKSIRKLVIRKTEGLGNSIMKPAASGGHVGRMIPAGGKEAILGTHGKEVV